MTDNTKPSTRIAICDTEIDENHPDLVGLVHEESAGYEIFEVHGTGVSSIAVAKINNGVGVTGVCDVCEVDFYFAGFGGKSVMDAAMRALEAGIRVFNTSYYILNRAAYRNLAAEVVARDAIWVTAAGNGFYQQANYSITSIAVDDSGSLMPGVIVVSSTAVVGGQPQFDGTLHVNDGGTNLAHNGHSYGPNVDLLAPGASVSEAYPGGGYREVWGTSQATPAVTGAVGMLLHEYPCLTGSEAERVLKATAEKDCLANFNPARHGSGSVNIAAALEYMTNEAATYNGTYYVNSNEVWDGEVRRFGGQVIIRNGARLTIENSSVSLAGGYGIVVEAGGALVASDSDFSSLGMCGGTAITMWGGISTDPRAFRNGTASRPRITLLNSKIRDAIVGVSDADASKPWLYNGGQMNVRDNDFVNCRTAIHSYAPSRPNYIYRNDIVVNDGNLISENYINDGATGISVNLVPNGYSYTMYDNTVTDTRTGQDKGMIGLHAYESAFDITANESGAIQFTGLSYGVYAQSSTMNSRPAKVHKLRMEGTRVGVWITGYNNPVIEDNFVNTADGAAFYDFSGNIVRAQGLRVEYCRRYLVRRNDITGDRQTSDPSYGMVFVGNAMSTTRDVVTDNTVRSCHRGAYSEGALGGEEAFEGLCYTCNNFLGNAYDITAVPHPFDASIPTTVSQIQQGVESNAVASARNGFRLYRYPISK